MCLKLGYFYRHISCMVLVILRYWIAFIFPAFYKRMQVKNLRNIVGDFPVIIAMNHPNAFTDPVGFTCLTNLPTLKYLARGDAFKPGFLAWALEKIGIVPIFRIQDGGKEGLKKNDEAYRRVNYFLKKNGKIMVFAEGLCVQERRLRPLKKGVARMVFGAYEAVNNKNLVIVPVGVNYSQPDKFRSTLFYNVGEPIYVRDLMPAYHENPAKAQNALLQMLEPKMKELITHIDDPADDMAVRQVEELCKRSRLKESGLNYRNLEHDFIVLDELTKKVNKVSQTNKPLLDEFKSEAKTYFDLLKKYRVRDWLIRPDMEKNISVFHFALRLVALIAGFPIYAVGLLANYAPFKLTHIITWKMIKNIEFYSSIAIGVGMGLFFIFYALWFSLIAFFTGSLFIAFCCCIVLGLCAWFSLYYYPFLQKTLGVLRILKNKILYHELKEKRKKLISLINKF
jgi:glycerol-3-phosphate O-acyltransferase/dihydroxyacetone phosphate acyltransferase